MLATIKGNKYYRVPIMIQTNVIISINGSFNAQIASAIAYLYRQCKI